MLHVIGRNFRARTLDKRWLFYRQVSGCTLESIEKDAAGLLRIIEQRAEMRKTLLNSKQSPSAQSEDSVGKVKQIKDLERLAAAWEDWKRARTVRPTLFQLWYMHSLDISRH